jgi:uncharacterized membrane protein SpoIIM required for sporulation
MRVKEDKFSLKQIKLFFSDILPQEIYNSRKSLLISLMTFVIAVSIGVISSYHDEEFPSLILGQSYITMTESNIEEGDPMAVYKDERKTNMFFSITTNNIRVSFFAFVLGIFGSVGTLIVLLQNGIMLGAFQYFFFSKGLFWTSFLTIWIHGTIEISAIIIAGGAGIMLGAGLLFPKTHSRVSSVQIHSLRALRLILGALPLFLTAGILESYVTRQTELPNAVKAGIIIASLLLVLIMWVIYPIYYHYKKRLTGIDYSVESRIQHDRVIDKLSYRSLGQIIGDGLLEFRTYMGSNMSHILKPTFLILIIILWVFLKFIYLYDSSEIISNLMIFSQGGIVMTLSYMLLLSYAMTMIVMSDQNIDMNWANKRNFLKKYFLRIAATTIIYFLPITLMNSPYWLFIYLILSPQLYVIIIDNFISDPDEKPRLDLKGCIKYSFKSWTSYLMIFIITMLFYWAGQVLINSQVINYMTNFLDWHHLFDKRSINNAFINTLMYWILLVLFLPLAYYLMRNAYLAIRTKEDAIDLNIKLKNFGQRKTIFES